MARLLSRSFWFACGVLAMLLLLEIVLRLLPVSIPLPRSDQPARWPLQYTPPHAPYSYSIGWKMQNAHRGVTNNYGHVAPFDFVRGSRPVIVMGDSFIESLMNDYPDTLQAQLAQKLGAAEAVYGLGVSGMSASGYVGLGALARDEFAPSAAVILITDGDLSESLLPGAGSHFLVPDGDRLKLRYEPLRGTSMVTRVRQRIGDISLHRYFQVNLQFSLENVFKGLRGEAAAAPRPTDGTPRQQQVVDWFLDALPASLGLAPGCVVLLLDSDRYALYKPELASARKDTAQARGYLIAQARSRGYQVADLEPVFREQYALDRVKFDHYPIDRHWNRAGHGVGAEQARRLLATPPAAGQRACLAQDSTAR
jgi:hypothetical protein